MKMKLTHSSKLCRLYDVDNRDMFKGTITVGVAEPFGLLDTVAVVWFASRGAAVTAKFQHFDIGRGYHAIDETGYVLYSAPTQASILSLITQGFQ